MNIEYKKALLTGAADFLQILYCPISANPHVFIVA